MATKKGAVKVKRKIPRLNDRQRKLVNAYFSNGFVKRQAALAAGYSKSTATYNTAALFNNPLVKEEIDRRFEEERRKYEVDRDWVVQRLARIANGGEILARFKRVNPETGELFWDFDGATPDDLAVITELTTDIYTEGRGKDAVKVKKMKVALADPKGALDSLARTLGLFQDNLKVEGELSIVERLQAGRRRLGSRDTKEG